MGNDSSQSRKGEASPYVRHRLSEIEDLIAAGGVGAPWVFTQMKQILDVYESGWSQCSRTCAELQGRAEKAEAALSETGPSEVRRDTLAEVEQAIHDARNVILALRDEKIQERAVGLAQAKVIVTRMLQSER